MDPNLFHLIYERLIEVLIGIVFLSLLIERALAILFESRWFIEKTESGDVVKELRKLNQDKDPSENQLKQKKKKGLKESIAFIVSVAVCWTIHFDAITIGFASNDTTTIYGYFLTGAIIAGGSKGSIKLFRDWMGFMSSAQNQVETIKNNKKPN